MRKAIILGVAAVLLAVLLAPMSAKNWTFTDNVHIQGNLTVDGTSPAGGGSLPIDNITGLPVPIAKGGTASDNAAGARTNLGADNASNLSSGVVAVARGGTGADSSASTGTPYVLSGTWSFDNAATFIARIWSGSGAYLKYDGTRGDPAGSVSGPATATQDNVVTWGADNTSIKDSGVALSALARLAGPTFTGTPAAPTAAADTNTTQISTTAFVIGQGYAKLVSPSFTTPSLGAATATSINTGQGANLLYQMNQNLRTTDNVVFGSVTTDNWVTTCIASDNACGITLGDQADPTGGNLEAAQLWFNTTSNLLKVRNGDNTATLTFSDVQWHRINIDAPTTADNVVFAGPLERAQVIDNVLFLVQDNTGKLSGASTDNVTVNISYCSSIATPTCTNVFTSNQVVTGAAISAGAMNNTAPSAGDYLRVTIAAANMTNKKLYIRVKYRST